MTADDILGTIVIEVPLNVYPANQIPPNQSIPAGEREIFQAISPGYAGSIAYFQAADSTVGLSTPGPDSSVSPPFSIPAESISVTVFPPDGVTLFYNPADTPAPGETRVITLSFRSEKMPGNEAAEEDFSVTVTVSIVSVPSQEPLETEETADFMHPLAVPGFDLSKGTFMVAGVRDVQNDQDYLLGPGIFAVMNGTLQLNKESDNPPTPDPGHYRVTVEMTDHPDIRGTLTLVVPVVVRGVLHPATYNLSGPSAPVIVAPGYAGNLRLQAPAHISLSSTAPADTRVELPDAFPAGVSLELQPGMREVTPHLTDPLAAGAELEAVLTLTIARGDLYNPLGQLVTVAVSALALPAVAAAEVIAPSPQNVFAAGGVVIDLAAADYENGVYNGADFRESGAAPELDVDAAGVVSAATDLAVGDYELTVVAVGRPQASGARFLGEVEITVSAGVAQGAETIAPDDVVPAAAREVNIDAAVGYAGAGYAIPVGGDYELIQESWDENVFGYDADGEVILITTAVGDDPFSYVVDAEARCASASGRFCETIDITITANFNPVRAPSQTNIPAAYLDSFAREISFPPGYEDGGPKSAGRDLVIAAVEGWENDIADLSLSFNGGTLEYNPGGAAANALTPGDYTIAFEMTQPDLLGTVAFEVAANISPRPLDAAEYGVSGTPPVTIVPGPNGVGLEIAAATLTGGAADAVLAIPDPANFPGKISLALSADQRGFTVFVTAAFASEETAEIVIPLTVSRPGGNYAPVQISAPVAVTALRQPALIEESAAGTPYNESNIANLKTGDFANATFEKTGGDAELLVDENTGIVSTNGDLDVGTYSIVVGATSPNDFFGTVHLTLRLIVSDRLILTPSQTIPSGRRSREIAAVAGYSGSVAFFAASTVGVTLQTPAAAPSGFNFGADGLNAEFVSPDGITLFLEAGRIPNGGDAAAADFEIAAQLGGFENEDITLNITVVAVAAPAQDAVNAVFLDGFSHALNLPSGYESGVVGRNLAVSGVGGRTGGAANLSLAISGDSLEYAPNGVEANALAAGQYTVTVAMTQRDLLGTMYLEVPAEIAPRALAGAEYALSDLAPNRITVAADYEGALYEVSLSAVSAVIAPPSAYPEGFTMALSPDSRRATLLSDSALDGGLERAGTIALTVVRVGLNGETDANYTPLAQSLRFTALALPALATVSLAGLATEFFPYANPLIYDFRAELGGVYADANFGKESGAAELTISREGIVSSFSDIASPGVYTLVATAAAATYLGAARAALELSLFSEEVSVSYSSVPADGARGTLTVSGLESGGTALFGATVTFVATPAEFNYVADWSSPRCAAGNRFVSESAECALVATTAISLSAEFRAVSRRIELSLISALGEISASSGGSVLAGGGEVPHGARVTFTATPQQGGAVPYYVSSWTREPFGGGSAEAVCETEIGGISDATPKTCALTADRDMRIAADFDLATGRLDARLSIAVLLQDPFDAETVGSLLTLGADANQTSADGEALLLRAAQNGKHLAVSILITAGADPDARSPTNNRQVPHWAAQEPRLEVLRHYIAAIGQVGHSYNWNDVAERTPLAFVQHLHGNDRSAATREVAALIYERGGRCPAVAGFYCDNVPAEERGAVVADDAQGDVFTIVARDFGAAEFDLSLPDANALTVLASIGWTLRLDAAERPHRAVLARGETTSRRAAIFTITAQYGGAEVRHYIVSARLASAADNPDAALAAEAAKFSPSASLVADLVKQGANLEQKNGNGDTLLLQAARSGRHPAVSVLIVAGADPSAQDQSSDYQVPHWAIRNLQPELLRHFIAAINAVDRSYNWNNRVADDRPPLEQVQFWHGNNRTAAALEIGALIYERGGRCTGFARPAATGVYCDNVPLEERITVIADSALGDVMTIAARDFGKARFDLALPAADELTVLASIGWSLRREDAERPHRVILARDNTVHLSAAVFTVTARGGGGDVRHYRVLARPESVPEDVNAALAAELEKPAPEVSRAVTLLSRGATLRADLAGAAGTLALQAALNNNPRAVSILITAGAYPEAVRRGFREHIPHIAARELWPELLRHYVAAIEAVGYFYDWNHQSTSGTPWETLRFWHQEDSETKREMGALLYARGSRCIPDAFPATSLIPRGMGDCDIPTEERNFVIADDARGDVVTLAARHFGTVRLDLTLPEAEALTVLASIGWSLRRDEAERPHRIVLTRNETTRKVAAVFTITARNGSEDVRHYMVSARLESAADDPDAALAAEMTMLSPDIARARDFLNQGADVEQVNNAGDTLLLQAAQNDRHLAVSVLIVVGADPNARTPANSRQVPHWAARSALLEVLRHYIAAIGQVGHSYDWNDIAGHTPLGFVQVFFENDRSEETREIAALIYERGGRCPGRSGFYCDNVPTETRNTVIADDARGDVFTVVARDLGAAEFDLSLPDANALTVLASIGWTLRLDAAERPHRVVLERGETARKVAAVFTITAQYGGEDVRHYMVSARLESAADNPDAALAAEMTMLSPDIARARDFLNQGADVEQVNNAGDTLLLQAAQNDRHLAVSVLIVVGADPTLRASANSRQVPHWAARRSQPEVLRHYIAAIGRVGVPYDWNTASDIGAPLGIVQTFHGNDRDEETREVAALIYERGGRCPGSSGFYCDNVPTETLNTVIADATAMDVFTIVARDLGAAEFDLALPDANALTALASVGWLLRREDERPQRIILAQNNATIQAAAFTITARNGGTDVRHYKVAAVHESVEGDAVALLAAELAAELEKDAPQLSQVLTLLSQGATLRTDLADAAGALALQAALDNMPPAVSILITAGANPEARRRQGSNNQQIPHVAAERFYLEVLRHYIAAIDAIGHVYDWNSLSTFDGTPWEGAQNSNRSDENGHRREVAALLYERGSRCVDGEFPHLDPSECAVPSDERNPVIADDARGDVFTIVARDFSAAVFDLSLPDAAAQTVLASIGWTLRLDAAARPHRVVLERGETTSKRAAVFTVTARSGSEDVRHYMVSARLASAADNPDAALAAEMTMLSPDISRARDFLNQGADVEQVNNDGDTLLLQAARNDRHLAVSVLIVVGADPTARTPANSRQVPHWAARGVRLEVLRHYIAAIGQVGRSYDWNDVADAGPPLDILQNFHRTDQSDEVREIAALIYERGGRCGVHSGSYCDNVPTEERAAVIADDARGDVFTIVARDFGAAAFDLSPPGADALTVLASIGWTLRLDAAERPHRVVLERGETTSRRAAMFTITAQYGGADVRHYMVSARLESAADDPDAALAAEMTMLSPSASLAADLVNQGADVEQVNNVGDSLLLQAARKNNPPAVSILIAVGADPGAVNSANNYQVPHWAARELRLELLRHYIAAAGQAGYSYDWNSVSNNGTPLGIVQGFHGNDRGGNVREIAALVYERGSRCPGSSGFYCDNVPSETLNTVIADAARGDVFTLVARDFGAAAFDLSLPDAAAQTVLASIGWTLRLDAAARPHRVVLERGETTSRRSATFTITAQYGGEDVRHYMVSARLESVADDPDAALAAELAESGGMRLLTVLDLLGQGATLRAEHANAAGTIMIQAATLNMHSAVSILITAGANPEARSPSTGYQVPHWAARGLRLEVLRHYIAAVGRVGHSYDWNAEDASGGTPLGILQEFHGGDRSAAALEIAALIYERGGRCQSGLTGFHCDTLFPPPAPRPLEERNTVIADDAQGDVLTIVARDFGAAEFDLSLPAADELTVLASVGWTLRLEAERPHRVVLTRGETTRKVAAVFTITAKYNGAAVRHYMVSARLESAVDNPDAALAAEMTMLSPDLARVRDFLNQGADADQMSADGETFMLQAARKDLPLLVSVLITAGANPDARSPATGRQAPHHAAREIRLEVLRHYIAAVGRAGRAYNWNSRSDSNRLAPLDIVQNWHGSDQSAETREVAALIYERGGRCNVASGNYCDTVPSEERSTVIADDARGDVFTIVARDFGAAEFDLSLPDANALTVLASIGWTLRLDAAERPHRAVLGRNGTTNRRAAVFTITAQYDGAAVRRYIVSARLAGADAALAAEVAKDAPDLARIADLAVNQGANVNQVNDDGEALLLQAARADKHLAVSVLITLGADPDARSPASNRQVPHLAARGARLEVLRHYIAAIAQVGHAYDWNSNADTGTPLGTFQNQHGSDRGAAAREIAALIYERGGRCGGQSGSHCNVPLEERAAVIADAARGDVFTIVARDFGAAEFDLSLPTTDQLMALADIGWTLRLDAAERPQRVVLERGETTNKRAATFTITAQYGGAVVRRYMVSARLESAVNNPDAALAAEVAKAVPNNARVADFLNQGADVEQVNQAGDSLLLQAARNGRYLAVSILVTAGANPVAQGQGGFLVPSWAARLPDVEVMRHYIAAIGLIGFSYNFWNHPGTPLDILQNWHGNNRNAQTRETAALIYERGGRCAQVASGFYCDNVPLEERNLLLPDAPGDVFTIVARDLGATEFDLSLPEAEALTILASTGWTLRLETERPNRVVLERSVTTLTASAVFTITARNGGADVRHYRVSARLSVMVDDPSAELSAELSRPSPDASWVSELFRQGATLAPAQTDAAGALMLQAVRDDNPPLVSVLITAGADADARIPGNRRQAPHLAARNLRLEALRHYIAAIGQVGHAYDWNSAADSGTPLQFLQGWNGNDRSARAREVAALIYERGGRCSGGYYCSTVPFEEHNPVIADAARGDVLTIIARDFGAAEFDLSLPAADELTVLASIGLSLRLETERPQRVVVARNDMTMTMAAVFTITARNDGTDVRHYIISAGVEGASGFAPPTTTPGKSAPDDLRTANLSKNPEATVSAAFGRKLRERTGISGREDETKAHYSLSRLDRAGGMFSRRKNPALFSAAPAGG